MSCSLSLASRCKHLLRIFLIAAGVCSGSAAQFGSSLRIATSVSVTVSPSKALFPVSISYSTHPNAQTSARLSTGLPRACSGLMYAAVPRMIPAAVARAVSVGECVTEGASRGRRHPLKSLRGRSRAASRARRA